MDKIIINSQNKALIVNGDALALRSNYIVYGSPTLTYNTMIPNQSTSRPGFISTDKVFNPGAGHSWTIQTKLTFRTHSAWKDVFTTVNSNGRRARSIVTQVGNEYENRKFGLHLSNNGSSWNICAGDKCVGVFPATGDKVFQLVCTYNNGIYTYKHGFPEDDWWTDEVQSSSHPTYGYYIAFGGGWDVGINAVFDLFETKIWIDNNLWWKAIG